MINDLWYFYLYLTNTRALELHFIWAQMYHLVFPWKKYQQTEASMKKTPPVYCCLDIFHLFLKNNLPKSADIRIKTTLIDVPWRELLVGGLGSFVALSVHWQNNFCLSSSRVKSSCTYSTHCLALFRQVALLLHQRWSLIRCADMWPLRRQSRLQGKFSHHTSPVTLSSISGLERHKQIE